MGLEQPFKLFKTVTQLWMDGQHVPHTWSSSCKTKQYWRHTTGANGSLPHTLVSGNSSKNTCWGRWEGDTRRASNEQLDSLLMIQTCVHNEQKVKNNVASLQHVTRRSCVC